MLRGSVWCKAAAAARLSAPPKRDRRVKRCGDVVLIMRNECKSSDGGAGEVTVSRWRGGGHPDVVIRVLVISYSADQVCICFCV